MGSAAGRSKCCRSFWMRGYAAGIGEPCQGISLDSVERYNATPGWFADTVSKSFQGLFRAGLRWGLEDRGTDRQRSYEDYREAQGEGK